MSRSRASRTRLSFQPEASAKTVFASPKSRPSSLSRTGAISRVPNMGVGGEGPVVGTGPSPVGPSGRLDLDASPLRALRLRDAHREHTVVQLGVDAFRVDLARKSDPKLEASDSARAPPDDAVALALFDLSADGQLAAGHLDVHVLALDPRHLGLDDIGVLSLLDVDC